MTKRKAQHSTGARPKVQRIKESLDELYLRADPRNISDPELAGDLSRYLCVRVSGFLEQAVVLILREYCSRNSWGSVQAFAHSWLDKAPNMNSQALVKLVRRFDPSWADDLIDFLADDERYSSLNALVGIRNDIAHGRDQSLSRENVWNYLRVTEEIIEWLLVRLEPGTPLEQHG
ncbi:HEPN_RiboL-PSP domain-containing protein [Frankia sp. Hr75.2]|nr:HEPN_RiboL-PSP domain-containing protein [Frankia sp. Hr75.2]